MTPDLELALHKCHAFKEGVVRSTFWDDHQADLADPEYARAFAAESVRIATIDSIINELADRVDAEGLSRADLARAIGADPSVVRRLLTAENVNPTLGTLSEVAAALGMKVTLAPMTAAERREITEPMTRATSQGMRGPKAAAARERRRKNAPVSA